MAQVYDPVTICELSFIIVIIGIRSFYMIIVYGSVPVIALVKGMIVYHHVSVRVVHRCMAVVQYSLYRSF